MFENTGRKLKVVAIVFFVLLILSAVGGAIACWSVHAIGAGFGTLIGGLFGAVFSAWMIYCVGDTNERMQALQEQVAALERKRKEQQETASAAKPAQATPTQQPKKPAVKQQLIPPKDGFGYAFPTEDGKERCSACGTVQNAGRNVCWNCGTRFQRDEQIWECPCCGRKNKGSKVCWNCGTEFRMEN
jgi:uncharacterized small protein (DUF1192 family)